MTNRRQCDQLCKGNKLVIHTVCVVSNCLNYDVFIVQRRASVTYSEFGLASEGRL